MLRVSILVANDKNTNAVIHGAVDDGVGKPMKRKPATLANRGSPKTWVCTEQHGDALELLDEPRCDGTPSFVPVEASGVTEIALRASVQRKGHSSSARNLAMASGPETGDEAPLSSSASRSAANLSQAASRALSTSRLATTRSSRRARSTCGRRSTSASRTSIGIDTVRTLCHRWAGRSACRQMAQVAARLYRNRLMSTRCQGQGPAQDSSAAAPGSICIGRSRPYSPVRRRTP
jgi:hypothetical protein